MREAFKKVILLLVKLYQKVGFTSSCRYNPTCSNFAHTAISRYGIIKGTRLSVKRILSCHPWSKGGFDAVP